MYVQPSLSEGLGTSVLEACAAALPVAASNTGGIPDVIIDRETGVLVESGSPESLAAGIIRLMRDADLRKRVAGAAREKVAREFSVAAMVEKTERAYAELVAERAQH
jgi:glycosyltransferase involved in cell wall biosynthesis